MKVQEVVLVVKSTYAVEEETVGYQIDGDAVLSYISCTNRCTDIFHI